MSVGEACFRNKVVVYAFALTVTLAGVLGYFKLGRLEDPEFTIRCAQVVTSYPGASAEEVADRVTDPIETAVQRLGQLRHVTSTSYPGKSIVLVEIEEKYASAELAQIWDELRRKVNDIAATLPQGCGAPQVVDDYGDVYGVFYAIYGDGFSYRELKEHAKLLRRELLQCSDVAKIELMGDREEIVSIEIPRTKLAALDVTPEELASVLKGQNVPVDAGAFWIDDKRVNLRPAGGFDTVEKLGGLLVTKEIRLRDIAEVKRAYREPARALVHRNGKPCIALGISTKKGGNVVRMGAAVEKRMRELVAETPVGIEVDVIAHQATSVETAVNGFVENLIESVILVIAILLVTMGLRSGLLIGAVLLMTVFATVAVMEAAGIMFERISLGAFIIALGMLVDNAIVITEAVLVAAERGESKMQAAIDVVKQTQWALLGGTVIAILSFAPIGACRNNTGEYCRSLFLVIGISLFLSWIAALTVTPLLAERFLKASKRKSAEPAADPYGGLFFRVYRRFLAWCIDNRLLVVFALVCALVASGVGFGRVKQNFFPDSTRPQFLVHVWMPEGTRVEKTDERVRRVAEELRSYAGVTGVSTFAGQGAMRFLLTYTPEDADSAYGLVLVDVTNDGLIADLMEKIERNAPALVPDAEVSGQRFVLGPGDPDRIQMRILGPDRAVLRRLGEEAMAVLRADGAFKGIKTTWRNRAELAVPRVAETRARKAGLTRAEISQAFRAATEGLTIGLFQEADEQLPIVLRAPARERGTTADVMAGWAWSERLKTSVPLAELVDGVDRTTEEMRLDRRERQSCITVKCNPAGMETAATAFARVRPELEKLAARFPAGYHREWGGEYENSTEANEQLAPSFVPILLLMVLTVLMLFNSVKKTLVIYLTLPLIVTGVVTGLLCFDKPFGFMALLGFLSLVGMQVKNAIVLMDEITARKAAGDSDYDAILSAGVSRLRPVFNASLTTVLGMLPLLADAFYSSMAVTIMVGLSFATVLTMVVIPVNYALIFKVRKPTA